MFVFKYFPSLESMSEIQVLSRSVGTLFDIHGMASQQPFPLHSVLRASKHVCVCGLDYVAIWAVKINALTNLNA